MKSLIVTIQSIIILCAMPYANGQGAGTDMDVDTVAVSESVSLLQAEWAKIKYQIPEKKEKLKALHALEKRVERLITGNPKKVEFKIWQAIILSTDAGVTNGMSSLGMLTKAKNLLLESIADNPSALSGSAYTSLATLYYQAPGWPISFGSNKKARNYFKKALDINPEGIDPNYFYGDFLIKQEKYDKAKKYLAIALLAPPRTGRPLADEGRRQEIRAALTTISDNINY